MNTTTIPQKSNARARTWPDRVNLALGAFLILSPWLALGGSAAITWNAVIFGACIALVAVAAIVKPASTPEWTNAVLGVWLLIAPWVLAFSGHSGAMWTSVLVGFFVAYLSGMQIVNLKRPAETRRIQGQP